MAVIKKKPKIKAVSTIEMEIALQDHLSTSSNIIAPNVRHGMFTHECDLAVISKAGYCTEIEIKISAADLKKTFLKNMDILRPMERSNIYILLFLNI